MTAAMATDLAQELATCHENVSCLREVVTDLRSALERTEGNFIAAVRGRPVRDMEETLTEVHAAQAKAARALTEV